MSLIKPLKYRTFSIDEMYQLARIDYTSKMMTGIIMTAACNFSRKHEIQRHHEIMGSDTRLAYLSETIAEMMNKLTSST